MSIRFAYTAGLLAIVVLLLISIGAQVFYGIMPCPLCTLQRLTFALLGVIFLVGIFLTHKYWGRLFINILVLLSATLGIGLAARQIWLQNFPGSGNNDCGVSLQYMLQALPFNEAMEKVFAGSAECTQRGMEFLHLNMAEWALVWFILFFLFGIYLLLKEVHWKN